MKRYWDEQELAEHWSLSAEESELLANRTDRSRLGLAVMLKFFQMEGRFPRDRKEIPVAVRDHLADQLGIEPDAFSEYDLAGRSSKRDREQIRSVLGFRRVTVADAEGLGEWLRRDVLSLDHKPEHLQQAALDWCRRNRIEPPAPPRMERIIRSALKAYEDGLLRGFPCQDAEEVSIGDGPLASSRGRPGRRWEPGNQPLRRAPGRSRPA